MLGFVAFPVGANSWLAEGMLVISLFTLISLLTAFVELWTMYGVWSQRRRYIYLLGWQIVMIGGIAYCFVVGSPEAVWNAAFTWCQQGNGYGQVVGFGLSVTFGSPLLTALAWRQVRATKNRTQPLIPKFYRSTRDV